MRVDLDPRSSLLQYRKMNTVRKNEYFEVQLNLQKFFEKEGTNKSSVVTSRIPRSKESETSTETDRGLSRSSSLDNSNTSRHGDSSGANGRIACLELVNSQSSCFSRLCAFKDRVGLKSVNAAIWSPLIHLDSFSSNRDALSRFSRGTFQRNYRAKVPDFS